MEEHVWNDIPRAIQKKEYIKKYEQKDTRKYIIRMIRRENYMIGNIQKDIYGKSHKRTWVEWYTLRNIYGRICDKIYSGQYLREHTKKYTLRHK